MKSILLAAALLTATSAHAVTRTADVWHVEKIDYVTTQYVQEERCTIQQVTRNSGQSAGEGALVGMIIGGILGKGVSGNDDGAAAGAVIGGIIGADKANKTSTTSNERVCNNVNVPVEVNKSEYIVHWKRNNLRGHFMTEKRHFVGDKVYVDVPMGH